MKLQVLLFLVTTALYADDRQIIERMYTSTFAALKEAQSKEDIRKMVDAFDVPEWISSQPNGQTLSRGEAVKLLEGMLAVPKEDRAAPLMQVAYYHETAANATILYWVYRTVGPKIEGSLARDTFARTTNGWRRVRHEKFFPDRTLPESAVRKISVERL
jgi:hypothetical protein